MTFGEKQRIYQKNPNIKMELLAKGIEQFLIQREDMICQIIPNSSGITIQTKKKDDWKKYLMLDNAVQINLTETDQFISIYVGGGKWISKVIAAGVGSVAVMPLAVPLLAFSSLGGFGTFKLADKIFEFVDLFLMTSGQNVLLLPYETKKTEELLYQSESDYEDDDYPTNLDFDSSDDQIVSVYSDPFCSKCASRVPENSKFCPGCGRKF